MKKKKIDTWPINWNTYSNRSFQLLGILFMIAVWDLIKIDHPIAYLIAFMWAVAAIMLYVFIPSIKWQGGKK